MKQSSMVHSCSYSITFRFVFFFISFCIFFLTTTHAQVVHRRLWPWPAGPWPSRPWPTRPWPFPWPMEPPQPGPPPNPSPKPGPTPGPSPNPPIPPKPQPKPPAPGPSPCPPIPPKPQPKPPPKPQPKPPPAPTPSPCPPQPPKPQPKPPPAPTPSPCPPQPPKPQPKPPPAPAPTPKPGPSPSPPKPPPSPAPKPVPPPSPSPKPSPPKPPAPSPNPSPPKPPAPSPKPSPPKPPAPSPPKPQNKTIPAVFFFGDSIFDTGNNNNLDTKLKCNYRPYGMDFPMGVATGRFSNGRVASDYISKYLGVKEIVPAYVDKKLQQNNELQETDLLTGVSFASGGAGYLPQTSESWKVTTMLDQLTYFQDYKKRMKKLVGKKKTKKIVSKGAAIVVAGSNDLVYTYFGNGAQHLKNDVDSFATMMADSAASFVLQLYGYGVRRIGVIGTPPIGCTPSQRVKKKKICNEDLNYAAQLFNSKLVIILGQLSRTLPNSTIVYGDIYSIFSKMLESPEDYGFEEIKKPCCKIGLTKGGVFCKERTSKICPNTSSYLFWDGLHPSSPPNPPPHNQTTPALFYFGDSIIDTGNNNNLTTEMKCNFSPYGMNFPTGVATGRFSNGRVASDYISRYLGLKSIVPAYLEPNVKLEELLTGVSFASGGSGYHHLTAKISRVRSMLEQLTYFEQYIARAKRLVGKDKTDHLLAKGLAIVVAGNNDLLITYYGQGAQSLIYDIHNFTSMMAKSAASFVTQLHGYGARQIAVIGTPPLGCVPSQRTLKGGPRRDCAQDLNYASQLFNAKLFITLDQLTHALPNSNVFYIDIYSPFSDIAVNAQDYGFEEITKGCCGTGLVEAGILCNRFTTDVCSNVSAYVFWDSFHPTQRFYKIVAKKLIERYIHHLK
uniref:Anther-specific proline rich protein n=1 Tax=Brassica campestris TaxID=3711 RepID=M4EAI6_BRACM